MSADPPVHHAAFKGGCCLQLLDLFSFRASLILGGRPLLLHIRLREHMKAHWNHTDVIRGAPADSHAFSTLKANLIERKRGPTFAWPRWLEKGPHELGQLTRGYKKNLLSLRGKVDLIVGGPPCQGFPSAGRRGPEDLRNQLLKQYLRVVGLVQPKMLLLENVRGISIEFAGKKDPKKRGGKSKAAEPFFETIRRRLERRGYATFPVLLRSSDYGVPQQRPRYFMMGVLWKTARRAGAIGNPFNTAAPPRKKFLERVSVRDAISDLRVKGTRLIDCVDSRGFSQVVYRAPRTPYQVQMHGSMNGHAPNSLRLPNHSAEIVARFEKMVKKARKGVSLPGKERNLFGVKKNQS